MKRSKNLDYYTRGASKGRRGEDEILSLVYLFYFSILFRQYDLRYERYFYKFY